MANITIFSQNVYVPATADIFITAMARQSYPGNNRRWQLEIWFGGGLVKTASGEGGYTDAPSMLVGLPLTPPGNYTVELHWTADTPLNLVAPTMVVQSSYK